VNKRGYLALNLGTESHEVHRLIALTFLGPRPSGQEVRHLDGDALNAAASNLAYGTRSENNLDKRSHGTDHNASKTHCPKGHPYAGHNLLTIPSRPAARYCRTCNVAQKNPDYRQEWKP
jgi:hypothetical protein